MFYGLHRSYVSCLSWLIDRVAGKVVIVFSFAFLALAALLAFVSVRCDRLGSDRDRIGVGFTTSRLVRRPVRDIRT